MNVRTRLAILVALCVASAVVVVSFLAYFATKDRLISSVDATLRGRASFEAARPTTSEGPFIRPDGGPRGPGIASVDLFQIIGDDGTVLGTPPNQDVALPVSERDRAVAAGSARSYLRTVTVEGEQYRVYTAAKSRGEAVQVARPLEEVNATLSDLRWILVIVGSGGVAVATLLGLVVSYRSLRPVAQLTAAAEHVATTQDLSHSIPVRGRDELGRLAASFNTMLQELNASREQQQRLVADANHELRTPLTSLRTNVEFLATSEGLETEQRAILSAITFDVDELTKIVSELVDLASDPRADERVQVDVRLDELVGVVVERARRRSGLRIELQAEPTLVVGNPELLERAATNLIENACKWSPPDLPIEVTVRSGVLEVSDHGPGIPAGDLPYVFDRFFRSAEARSTPGSGLGLSIVKQIIEAHGGAARVDSAPSGTRASFSLPAVDFDSTTTVER
jgi:two-component system, OmpR family, sensor histidine kinase MprB